MNKLLVRACKTINFGDTINKELVKLISGITPDIVNNSFKNINNRKIYMVVGSILGWCDKNTIVWGSGFLHINQKLTSAPKKICAVRGKLTREIFLKQGIDCPEVYGDPVLLLAKFGLTNSNPQYKLGFICHHIDKVLMPKLKEQFPTALFIDIQGGIFETLRKVSLCETIASSALHGIILADAYNIPSVWIKLSEKVLGHGFKFRDYFSSINRKDIEPLIWTPKITLQDINNKLKKWNPMELDLNPLLEVCPFRRNNDLKKRRKK